MPGIPTPSECRALFAEVNLGPDVILHVEGVAKLGVRVARALQDRGQFLDKNLVHAGFLLHDLGRAKTHGLDHAMVGARMLRDRNFPEELALCVERHTGGGIDATEAAKLGLPLKDYNPVTLEEKLVCHIDNLFDHDQRQPVTRELEWLRSKGLEHVAEKIQKLHAQISTLLGKDLDKFK